MGSRGELIDTRIMIQSHIDCLRSQVKPGDLEHRCKKEQMDSHTLSSKSGGPHGPDEGKSVARELGRLLSYSTLQPTWESAAESSAIWDDE